MHRNGVLETYGMTRSLMKADGAPTTHYLLDEDAFIDKLAHFLSMAFDEVKLRLIMIVGDGKASGRKKSRKGDADYGSGEYASFINNFDQQPPPEIKQEIIMPESKPEEAKPVTPKAILEPHILALAEETNSEPAIIARFDFDETQSIWTHIREGYPKSVKHWREHSDLLMHAFVGLPFTEVSAELIHRVQLKKDRNSHSSYYRPTVHKHSLQLHKVGLL